MWIVCMSLTAETLGPVSAMEEPATRKNLPTNIRLRSKNIVDKLRSGKQLHINFMPTGLTTLYKIPKMQIQCNTLYVLITDFSFAPRDHNVSHHS